MDKDRARKEIERIFEQYSGFIVEFEDWTDTGEDDLLVTVTTHQEHKSELYLTDGESGTYLYIGEDVIEPLTEANVLWVMFFQALREINRLNRALEQARTGVRERCALVCEKRAAMWEEVATKPASYPVALHDAKAAEAWSCGADIRAME
jgi:hypothetical protein